MNWLEFTVEVAECNKDQAEEALLHAGAIAVTLSDAGDHPILEPLPGQAPCWPSVKLTGLFDSDCNADVIKFTLSNLLGNSALKDFHIAQLADQEWALSWMDRFRPMSFGSRLQIFPSHYPLPEDDRFIVKLDPGLAFGTGTHPTTELCLNWLDQHIEPGMDVLDYGCGSGILAIASIILGANKAYCVDIDPQALTATIDNAEKNQVSSSLVLKDADKLSDSSCDVLVANILAGPLIELSDRFMNILKPGGSLVLSGLLADQHDALLDTYSPYLNAISTRHKDEWILISGKKQMDSS